MATSQTTSAFGLLACKFSGRLRPPRALTRLKSAFDLLRSASGLVRTVVLAGLAGLACLGLAWPDSRLGRKTQTLPCRKQQRQQQPGRRRSVAGVALCTAVVDSEALTDGGAAILQGLENMGVQYEVKKLPVDSTIGWMRDSVTYVPEENGQVSTY